MLNWTGERFLPWLEDATIAYEHLHRYAYAIQFVKDKAVLDLAAGEGYGANILAASAGSVVGIDIDPSAVQHASTKYNRPNLQFIAGSITEIAAPDRSFDVVTCFEAIEHIEDQAGLLREVKRVLRPSGLFIVSTPNKDAYHSESEANPFHVKELTPEEFEGMLHKHFANLQFLGQRIHGQSSIWQLDERGSHRALGEVLVQRREAEFAFAGTEQRVPLYLIALCSEVAIPLADSSVLVDISDQLIRQKDAAIADLLAGKSSDEKALKWLNQQLEDRHAAVAGLESAVQWQSVQIDDLKSSLDGLNEAIHWLKGTIAERELTIQSHEQALEWRASQVQGLQNEVAGLHRDLDAITSSTGWKWILRLCRIRDGLFPEGSLRKNLFTRLFRARHS
jgi:ubiquinone/menaquinone biosynthesis C-methylase UbiE